MTIYECPHCGTRIDLNRPPISIIHLSPQPKPGRRTPTTMRISVDPLPGTETRASLVAPYPEAGPQ